MSDLKILIVEDELITATHIASVLESKGYETLEPVTKGELVPGVIDSLQPNIVIMDIQLAGKLNGIETARIISQTSRIPVVFLTSNSDVATFEDSKSAYPYAFVSKPFKEDELLRTIELIKNRLHFAEEKSESQTKLQLDDRIFVRDKDKMVKIKVADILYVEADRNYCTVVTESKEYVLSVSLKAFEDKILSDTFIRTHRSFLVNLAKINKLDDNYVYLSIKTLPVGKSYKKLLLNKLNLI